MKNDIYDNVDCIKPGDFLEKCSKTSDEEEFFFVLNGEGLLLIQDEKFEIRSGDLFSKSSKEGFIHKFVNNGEETLEIVDCGYLKTKSIINRKEEKILLFKNEGIILKTV